MEQKVFDQLDQPCAVTGVQVQESWRHGARKFHDVESALSGVWDDEEKWSQDLLCEFLAELKAFPPLHECLVWRMLGGGDGRPVPNSGEARGQRRQQPADQAGGCLKVLAWMKRRPFDGNSI